MLLIGGGNKNELQDAVRMREMLLLLLACIIGEQEEKWRKIPPLYFICLHDVSYKAAGRCLISSSNIYSIHCESCV